MSPCVNEYKSFQYISLNLWITYTERIILQDAEHKL